MRGSRRRARRPRITPSPAGTSGVLLPAPATTGARRAPGEQAHDLSARRDAHAVFRLGSLRRAAGRGWGQRISKRAEHEGVAADPDPVHERVAVDLDGGRAVGLDRGEDHVEVLAQGRVHRRDRGRLLLEPVHALFGRHRRDALVAVVEARSRRILCIFAITDTAFDQLRTVLESNQHDIRTNFGRRCSLDSRPATDLSPPPTRNKSRDCQPRNLSSKLYPRN